MLAKLCGQQPATNSGACGSLHWQPTIPSAQRRLSSSALANPREAFGTCRLLGFVLATCRGTDAACQDSDVPHLALEQTLLGDKVGRVGGWRVVCWVTWGRL